MTLIEPGHRRPLVACFRQEVACTLMQAFPDHEYRRFMDEMLKPLEQPRDSLACIMKIINNLPLLALRSRCFTTIRRIVQDHMVLLGALDVRP